MNGKEIQSPLFKHEEFWNQADVHMGSKDIADIFAEIDAMFDTLDKKDTHTKGTLELFEETIGDRHFRGRILRTLLSESPDVALTGAPQDEIGKVYMLSSWEYNPGAKLLPSELGNIVGIPRVRHQIYLHKKPPNRYSAGQAEKIVNSPFDSDALGTLTDKDEKRFNEIIADYHRFTIYSLYKVNNILKILCAPEEVA